ALVTDSRPPSSSLSETLLKEQRFRRLNSMMPEETAQLYEEAELDLRRRFDFLTMMAGKAEKNPQE
ncbi:pyruvate-flavodoxin oxidoreductase, partial [Pectobacterium versatile]